MHISPKPIHEYPWYVRIFFWKQKHTYGKTLDPGLLWGRSPWLFSTVAFLYGAINRRSSPLEPSLRSLLTVRVSQINHCTFCVDINANTLMKRGVSQEKVDRLSHWWKEQNLAHFTHKECLALEYAEAMTWCDRDVDEELVGRLKQVFDDDSIVELTGLVAFQNLSSKFNAALDIPAQGFCRIPPKT